MGLPGDLVSMGETEPPTGNELRKISLAAADENAQTQPSNRVCV
ncbi:MAG: hypothetical protein JWN86_29 [Planctomycetota bacterium]|nr:hypothetical protein [Planctomycetota bacterium]